MTKVAQTHEFGAGATLTLCARRLITNGLAQWRVGDAVSGAYLSQHFTAQVFAATLVKPGWYRLELDLDEAIDVVTSDGFPNLRKRVRSVVGPKHYSEERTSDGQADLHINL